MDAWRVTSMIIMRGKSTYITHNDPLTTLVVISREDGGGSAREERRVRINCQISHFIINLFPKLPQGLAPIRLHDHEEGGEERPRGEGGRGNGDITIEAIITK